VQVVDEDRDRRLGRRPLDQTADRLEHAGAFQTGVAELDQRRHTELVE
jgi:hypothetical protein